LLDKNGVSERSFERNSTHQFRNAGCPHNRGGASIFKGVFGRSWLFLVNAIILPLRSPRSARQYQKIWTKEGSPLLVNSLALQRKVQESLGSDYQVEIGMRYGKPSIQSALKKFSDAGIQHVSVLPLFPQQAASSSGSAIRELFRVAALVNGCPNIQVLPPFYKHEGFIKSFVRVGLPCVERFKPDHILFSFHGLPVSHVLKGDGDYPVQCETTTKLIAKSLNLAEAQFSTTFQSRLGPVKWIQPYTDKKILDLIGKGKRRLLIFAPSFVADCLETSEEIGIRLKELALKNGAEAFELVPSLNSSSIWVDAISEMVS
jgi:protoporphyrin/coproporphyrin ferrochelatase